MLDEFDDPIRASTRHFEACPESIQSLVMGRANEDLSVSKDSSHRTVDLQGSRMHTAAYCVPVIGLSLIRVLFVCGSSTELVGSSGAELQHNPRSFQLKTRLLRARARARERERTRKGLQYYCWFIHPRTYISAGEHESGELLLISVVYRLC